MASAHPFMYSELLIFFLVLVCFLNVIDFLFQSNKSTFFKKNTHFIMCSCVHMRYVHVSSGVTKGQQRAFGSLGTEDIDSWLFSVG